MGSAVVVWLEAPERQLKPQKYLLTCCHVVRGGSDHGPLQSKIACWPPGKSYVPLAAHPSWPDGPDDGTWTAKVFDVLERPASDFDQDDVSAADDWVLLEVDDADFQEYQAVSNWAGLRNGRKVTVVGYPGGSNDWINGDTVEPYEATGFTVGKESASPGTLSLKGKDRTAGGMSGGGLFEPDGTLVGLHRAQSKESLQFGAVRAEHIQEMLSARGYKLLPGKQRPKKPPWLILVLVALITLTFGALWYFNQPRPKKTTEAVGLGYDFSEFRHAWSLSMKKKDAIIKDLGRYDVSTNWDHLDVLNSEPIDDTSGIYIVGIKGELPEVKIRLNANFHQTAADRRRILDNVRGHLLLDQSSDPPSLTVVLDQKERQNLVERDPISFDKFLALLAPNSTSTGMSEFRGVHITNWVIPEISYQKNIGGGVTEYEIAHPANNSAPPDKWAYMYIEVDKNRSLSPGDVISGLIVQSTKQSVRVKAKSVYER